MLLAGVAFALWQLFGGLFADIVEDLSGVRGSVERDLYLVEFSGSQMLVLGDARTLSVELPPTVDPKEIGQTYGTMKIRGVIPVGTVVEITHAERKLNTPTELRGRLPQYSEIIDLSFIQDYSSSQPAFRSSDMRLLPPIVSETSSE